jgi:hypothetical protein
MSRLYVIRSGDTGLLRHRPRGRLSMLSPSRCSRRPPGRGMRRSAGRVQPQPLLTSASWSGVWRGSGRVQPQPLLIGPLLVGSSRTLRAGARHGSVHRFSPSRCSSTVSFQCMANADARRLLHRPYGRVRVTPLSGREEGRRTWGAAPRTDAMSVDLRPFGGTPPSGATLRKLIQKLATESFVNSPQVTEMTRSGVPRRRARAQRRRPAGRRR